MITADLFDTLDDMISIDPRRRLRAEYAQTAIRHARLEQRLDCFRNGAEFIRAEDVPDMVRQADIMSDYLDMLQDRARREGIDLDGGDNDWR